MVRKVAASRSMNTPKLAGELERAGYQVTFRVGDAACSGLLSVPSVLSFALGVLGVGPDLALSVTLGIGFGL
jgi:hypothetical protein